MKTRIISACFIAPVLLFFLIGGIPLFAVNVVISIMAMREFFNGFENIGIRANRTFAYAAALYYYALICIYQFTDLLDPDSYNDLLKLWFALLVICGISMPLFSKKQDVYIGPVSCLGVLYLAYLGSHITLTSEISGMHDFVWLIVITAFGSDIFAYFTGYFLGKHKLCPKLSPKKTIEGAIGGVLGSCLCCLLFARLFMPEYLFDCAIIGLIGSVFSQAGDLAASAFKRKMGIKDYSDLIPGHGGILDRFDSMMFTAPFVYFYIIMMMA